MIPGAMDNEFVEPQKILWYPSLETQSDLASPETGTRRTSMALLLLLLLCTGI
jgi:hypothetical protein